MRHFLFVHIDNVSNSLIAYNWFGQYVDTLSNSLLFEASWAPVLRKSCSLNFERIKRKNRWGKDRITYLKFLQNYHLLIYLQKCKLWFLPAILINTDHTNNLKNMVWYIGFMYLQKVQQKLFTKTIVNAKAICINYGYPR